MLLRLIVLLDSRYHFLVSMPSEEVRGTGIVKKMRLKIVLSRDAAVLLMSAVYQVCASFLRHLRVKRHFVLSVTGDGVTALLPVPLCARRC